MSAAAGAMKRALAGAAALLLLLGASVPARGQELSRYEETVTLAADGSAQVRVVLQVRQGGATPALLPLRAAPASLRTAGIGPASARVVQKGSAPFIELDLPPGASPGRTVAVEYSLPGYFQAGGRPGPFGNRKLDYRFANVSFSAIDRFSASLLLPEGWVFNAVSRFAPAPEKEGMVAPFTIARAGRRLAGRIDLSGLGLGSEAVLSCTVRSGRRSLGLLFALAVLAAAWLLFYRDVLKVGRNGAPAKLP